VVPLRLVSLLIARKAVWPYTAPQPTHSERSAADHYGWVPVPSPWVQTSPPLATTSAAGSQRHAEGRRPLSGQCCDGAALPRPRRSL